MLEFLTNLSPIQWVLIGIGIIILLPNIIELFKKIPLPKVKTSDASDDGALTDIVSKWECLHNACAKEGLEDACEKLEDMFPCLIKVRNQTNPEPKIPEKDRAN
jgi:hypothetical protein